MDQHSEKSSNFESICKLGRLWALLPVTCQARKIHCWQAVFVIKQMQNVMP